MTMTLRPEMINLLKKVVSEQQPDLLPVVDRLASNLPVRREEKRRLILVLADEVARTGFFETDESVKRGLMLEEIADALGDMQSNDNGLPAMIWNGLMVTTEVPCQQMKPDTIYRGVAYGEAWPLQELPRSELSPRESALVANIDSLMQLRFESGKEPPGVVNDIQLAYDYAGCCQDRDIPVRLLLCATTSSYPRMDDAVVQRVTAQAQLIGYDYIGAGWGYSALYDDLYSESLLAELEQFTQLLNAYGLFDTEADLARYIETRWRIVQQAGEKHVMHGNTLVRETPLEDWGSFWPCAVYELPWNVRRAEPMNPIKHCLCPVCGYNLSFAPWVGKSPADEMCPCCGIQFGYDDWAEGDLAQREQVYVEWRRQWIADGMPWRSRGVSLPEGWNPKKQLREAGIDSYGGRN